MAVSATVLLTLGNLRGLRESGSIFAVPTYVFILAMYGLIAYGVTQILLGGLTPVATEAAPAPSQTLGLFLILTRLLRMYRDDWNRGDLEWGSRLQRTVGQERSDDPLLDGIRPWDAVPRGCRFWARPYTLFRTTTKP